MCLISSSVSFTWIPSEIRLQIDDAIGFQGGEVLPMISSRFLRLVVPTIEAFTPEYRLGLGP